MDELLDLVNEKDEVIGEVWKSKANSQKGVLHREILVYIFNSQGQLLLQQRSFNKKVYPGSWEESCAGHIGKGEDPGKAAHRELKEELGFETKLKFVGKTLVTLPNETHFAYCYTGKYNDEEIKPLEEEVARVKFVNEDEMEKLFKIDADEATESEIGLAKKIWKDFRKQMLEES